MSQAKLVDAHTHLNDPKIFDRYQELLKEFEASGGVALTNIGTDRQRNERAIHIAKNNPTNVKVFAAIGYHPDVVINAKDELNIDMLIQQLKQQILENTDYVKAIGEI